MATCQQLEVSKKNSVELVSCSRLLHIIWFDLDQVDQLPDKVTKSPVSRPCSWKLAIRVSREEFGAGTNLLAPSKLALMESLLPK